MTKTLRTVAVVAGLVVLWWVASVLSGAPSSKFPSPLDVFAAASRLLRSGELLSAVASSVFRLVLGFAIGCTLGLVVGLLVATNRTISDFIRPLATFFQAIAGVAWIPIAIVWFGLGAGPTLFVTANAVFFIILFNTIAGVAAVPDNQVAAVRVLGGGPIAIFREVLFPGALAYVLVGVETGLAFAWRALISVEIIAGTNGLGFLLNSAGQRFDGATIVLVILIVGTMWLLVERFCIRPLKSMTIDRWHLTTDGTA